MAQLLCKVEQVADLLAVSVATVWNWNAVGALPAPIKIGRNTLWRVTELQAWVDAGMPPRVNWEWPVRTVATPVKKGGRK